MNFFSNFERKLPWSFLGVVIAMIFGVFGIYTVLFYHKKPDFIIQVTNDYPVFSLREQVQGLDVMFRGKNIKETHQGLSVLTLRLGNHGNAAIRTSDFDSKAPLLINFPNAEIIKADFIDSSDQYFKKVFSDIDVKTRKLTFPSFIMEPNKVMNIRLLILHNENEHPTLKLCGKIANISKLKVIPYANLKQQSKNITVFSGDIKIQSFRILTYGLATSLCIVVVVFICILISNRLERIKDKKWSKQRIRIAAENYLKKLSPETREQLRPFAYLVKKHNLAYSHHFMRLLRSIANADTKDIMQNERFRIFLREVEMLVPDFDARNFKPSKKLLTHLQEMLKYIALNV